MTPSELADRLDGKIVVDSIGTEELQERAAAMLREAVLLFHMTGAATLAWANAEDIDADSREQWGNIADRVNAWLAGRMRADA